MWRRLLFIVAAGLLAVSLLVALGVVPVPPLRESSDTAGPSGATNPPPTTASPPSPSSPPPSPAPTAGPPVLAVKVDNAPVARPPVGIGAADVIYVEPVEGGMSRLIAVFGSHKPPVVGPVRSARETDLRLLPQFGHPALAFSGAAPELLPRVRSSPLRSVSQDRVPRAYFRGESRDAPHNLFVRPAELPPGGRWAPDARLEFGPAPPGGVSDGSHTVHYTSATMGFDWAPQQERWLVSLDGRPFHAADSGRLSPSTVVVQRVPVVNSAITDVLGNPSPVARTVGEGRALVLRDGRAFEARWSRPAPEAATTYTTPSGQPIPFAPGQVWVVLAPAGR
ncbi:DUF3048 family protein [Halopolyspora algeriensis]|uniref:DUF3048 family protein n=1 Tax=Halopolyspora algeriensis TaxID=1500506 RepID=A0A368W1W4_9ACTN|nr:DUF3048 domain-containing protein [Halopolyspora algeriensis]RCW45978.1 DUF3048 family protein [Halopolyspora algeriensis]TQM55391.1 DUF3048 family protein [Halopolyspora algeriensis]